jgi:ribosomal protein L21E
MTQACPQQWSKWLPLAEFWYNTTFHSALGKTPFEVLYGYKPKHFGIQDVPDAIVPDLQTWLEQRDAMQQIIQQNLLRAQQRMKSQADKTRVERTFEVGDQVYLKLQPYVQMSVARRTNQKLSYKFFGPYKVLQRVGAVAYKLELPTESLIHPVVHVSLLKKALPANTIAQPDLPSQCTMLEDPSIPLQVLDTKEVVSGKNLVCLVQVQWTGLPNSWTTWENKNRLMKEFPNAPAWGQADLQGEGNVTACYPAHDREAQEVQAQKEMATATTGHRPCIEVGCRSTA